MTNNFDNDQPPTLPCLRELLQQSQEGVGFYCNIVKHKNVRYSWFGWAGGYAWA